VIKDQSGASAVEFAIVGPMFVMMLLGICAYGGYFWMAHAVQQLANDGARAAVAGLDASERTTLAQSAISGELTNYAYLALSHANVAVSSTSQSVSVTLTYDASNTPFWSLDRLIPMPSSTISRGATVMLGGY
jgi:Flp pilus assembly protein TadG